MSGPCKLGGCVRPDVGINRSNAIDNHCNQNRLCLGFILAISCGRFCVISIDSIGSRTSSDRNSGKAMLCRGFSVDGITCALCSVRVRRCARVTRERREVLPGYILPVSHLPRSGGPFANLTWCSRKGEFAPRCLLLLGIKVFVKNAQNFLRLAQPLFISNSLAINHGS